MPKAATRTLSTDLEIRKLIPELKHYWVKDLISPGLFLEVSPNGSKTWQYRYSINGKQERVKLGKYPAMTLNQARSKRSEYEEKFVSQGKTKNDVAAQNKKQESEKILFNDFAKIYAERYIIGKIKNEKIMLAYINNDIKPYIGNLYLRDITVQHIEEIISTKVKQGFQSAAHTLRQLLKRLFDLAVDFEYIDKTPVKKTTLELDLKIKPKQRALSTEEITFFYTSVFQNNSARATKLGLLLAILVLIRKSELTQAQWKDINFDTGIWHIPSPKGAENSKYSSEPFNVYMSTQVKSILKELKLLAGTSTYILPGRNPDKPISRTVFNMAVNTILKSMPDFGHLTVHDLRRTAASRLNDLGYNSDIIEKCLNHKMQGIRGIYNKAEYETQRQEMMQEWSNYVFELVPILNHFIELGDENSSLIDCLN